MVDLSIAMLVYQRVISLDDLLMSLDMPGSALDPARCHATHGSRHCHRLAPRVSGGVLETWSSRNYPPCTGQIDR